MKKKLTVIGVILIAILLVVGGYLFHAHKTEEKLLEQSLGMLLRSVMANSLP